MVDDLDLIIRNARLRSSPVDLLDIGTDSTVRSRAGSSTLSPWIQPLSIDVYN